MAELTPEEEAASARAAEQARLRKARREAKIKAGAESRLKTITGLGGGFQRDPAPAAAPAAAPTATAAGAAATAAPAAGQPRQHADPEEVDIAQHYYQPKTTPRVPPASTPNSTAAPTLSDSQLRQMMLGLDQPAGTSPSMPGMPPGAQDDPMLRMMMQMLGGGNAPSGLNNNSSNNPFMPPTAAQPPQAQAQAALPNRHAALWRLVHTAVALALGLYIALCTPFRGTKLERDRAAAAAAGSAEAREQLQMQLGRGDDGGAFASDVTRNFFWAFATAEALLLATRYLLEQRGSSGVAGGGAAAGGGGGILGLLVGFLPAGVRGKVELAMRYGQVLGTVRRDVLVCVFVLGAAAWWRG